MLKWLNLDIKNGESIAIMGNSGSGKSTLLNIIGCIDNADSGGYLLKGEKFSKDLNRLSEIRNKDIAFVMQNFALIEEFTVLDNYILTLNFRKMSKSDKVEKIKKYLKGLGIEEPLNKKVFNLSGGQKQRVAIARALAQEIEVIIADEQNTRNIMEILKKLNLEYNKTIVVVTHDSEVAKNFGKVYPMEDRKLR